MCLLPHKNCNACSYMCSMCTGLTATLRERVQKWISHAEFFWKNLGSVHWAQECIQTLAPSVHRHFPSLCWHHLRLLSARFSLRILKAHGGSWLLGRCLRETAGMILPWDPQNMFFSDPVWIPEWNVVSLSSNLWSLVYKGLARFLAHTLVSILSVTVFGVKRNMQHYW